MPRERIVVDDDDVFGRLTVEREPAPLLQLLPANDVELEPEWRGCGAERGRYEAARAVDVEYQAPGRRA